MLEELVKYDEQLFLFLNGLGGETWDGFWLFMTNKWSSIPLYAILLFLSIRYFGWKGTAAVLVLVALMITATDQLANLFKENVARLRPCHNDTIFEQMRLVKAYCGGKYGYFSAHAGNSFAVATFFSMLFRKELKGLAPILVIWAILVSYSRIYVGVHFPLDVVTGITVGMLLGLLFFFVLKKLPIADL